MVEDGFAQLTLSLAQRPAMEFDSFFAGANVQLVSRLQALARGEVHPWLYLWGPEQSGRSHLLQALTQLAQEHEQRAFYLAAAEARALSPALTENLHDFQLLVIDDIQWLMEAPDWAESLFHLYNKFKDMGGVLVVSATAPPGRLQTGLLDLRSRLQAMEVYHLQPLNDTEKARALRWLARQRGFHLSEELVAFIMARSDRTMAALKQVIERLDELSLQQKRVVTIPFVKKVMGW
ncbi:MAG: DnaA regulatory inactivator Hda [Pseudomonadota bacterium]|nr:DnaA regulatory inactivator Hda [Pseudomonadales bacterium]MDY6922185.1 DnaA regulatory inactivator Hda [Pseudomonadota bacterium]